jgi:hypothetical protein
MFTLRHYHKYSDADMLEWLPFERQIYLDMLLKALEEEKKAMDKIQRH